MNTPTQEQIEAALDYAYDRKGTLRKAEILSEFSITGDIKTGAMNILAAAYRAKCKELEAMKQPAQLPQHFPN